jgi:hypothetical protein
MILKYRITGLACILAVITSSGAFAQFDTKSDRRPKPPVQKKIVETQTLEKKSIGAAVAIGLLSPIKGLASFYAGNNIAGWAALGTEAGSIGLAIIIWFASSKDCTKKENAGDGCGLSNLGSAMFALTVGILGLVAATTIDIVGSTVTIYRNNKRIDNFGTHTWRLQPVYSVAMTNGRPTHQVGLGFEF